MTDTTNPYRPGEPVADPTMLFGRQNAADWIELQLNGNARTLVLSALPLIGKTSFVRHVGSLQSLDTLNLMVALSAPVTVPETGPKRSRQEARGPDVINAVLQSVIDQLVPQLKLLDLTFRQPDDSLGQPATILRHLFVRANQRLGSQRLVLYLDDLHLLLTHDKALIAAFLSSLLPLLDECPRLHLVFVLNQDKLRQISHPLLDGAPTFNLGVLTADASLNMITLPVKNILRFDYGVTKRIAEINSHHPYYLCLFCYTLLNRQVHDGWVNQRDFDAALAEILDTPIEPFTQIWDQSTWAERAVLAGMAAIQGAHGPITRQEVTRFLQRQNSAVVPDVVVEALESLAERGVLAPMGALSYRFHVELLRFWLREHTNPAEILKEVDWGRAAAQLKPAVRGEKASLPPIASTSRPGKSRQSGMKRLLWLFAIFLLVVLCLLTTGAVFAVRFLDIPLTFLTTPIATPTALAEGETLAAARPTPTIPPEPTATPTPTPPLVVARTLPSLTYMGRDIDQSWRVYVMNSDGTGATALSPEGEDDTAPIWSPDGQKIAFVSQRDGNREVYVMNADGQNVVNVSRHPADDWTPAWSPDGKRLAFSSIRTGNWEIFVMDVTCLNDPETCPDSLTQLTADGNGNLGPVWSLDGSRIAFSSKAAGNWDIYTMTSGGSDLRQITTDPANDLSPAWSPDGSRIAFETNRDGNVEVYVMEANGGAPQNVSNFSQANDHGPTWSPDGQLLVFYSNREGNWDIFTTTLDGQTVVNLTQTPTRDEQTPAWRP